MKTPHSYFLEYFLAKLRRNGLLAAKQPLWEPINHCPKLKIYYPYVKMAKQDGSTNEDISS